MPLAEDVARAIGGAIVHDDDLAFQRHRAAQARIHPRPVEGEIDVAHALHDLRQGRPLVVDGHHD
jgi:hypothetical protein